MNQIKIQMLLHYIFLQLVKKWNPFVIKIVLSEFLNGSLIWKEQSDRDVIYAEKNFDSNGKLKAKNDGGVDVGEKGHIASHTTTGSVEYSDDSTQDYSFIGFDNEDKALGVHEYISNNVDVEFIVGTGLKDGSQNQ